MDKINNIKKESYDSSISDTSSVYRNSDYNETSAFSINDQELENPSRREIFKLDHDFITNTKYNQVNDVINIELKFDRSNSLSKYPVNYPLPIVTVILRGGKIV